MTKLMYILLKKDNKHKKHTKIGSLTNLFFFSPVVQDSIGECNENESELRTYDWTRSKVLKMDHH